MIIVRTFCGGYDNNFSYLIYDESSHEAIIIDTALDPQEIIDFALMNGLAIRYAVVMHSHFDHAVKLEEYTKNNIPLLGSPLLPFLIDKRVNDNETILLGNTFLRFIAAPGHTPDCILLYGDGKLFTTDVLFINSCELGDIRLLGIPASRG